MLKKAACEDYIDRIAFHVHHRGAVIDDQLDIGILERCRIRIYIQSNFPGAADIVDELAISGSEIHHRIGGLDPPHEVLAAEQLPYLVFARSLLRREASFVQALEVLLFALNSVVGPLFRLANLARLIHESSCRGAVAESAECECFPGFPEGASADIEGPRTWLHLRETDPADELVPFFFPRE